MATVVLLGCSTSGKSSAVRRFGSLSGQEVEVIDTDAVVAADSEFKGDLYAMHLKFTKHADTSAAQLFLELGERYLLRQLASRRDSIVIAAGPNIPFREPEWSYFRGIVKPVCIYLRLNASQLYDGLKQRRERQRRKNLDLCPGFGCWDAGLGTVFNSETDNWDELTPEEALPLIENHLLRVDPVYASFCDPDHIVDGAAIKLDPELQSNLATIIDGWLRWTPYPMATSGVASSSAIEFG